MWTTETRARYDRSRLRYPSDLADEEWALIGPLIPPAKSGGNKRTVDVREVVNGVMYVLSAGCQWVALPKDLPPRSTVNDYFRRWDDDGTLLRIHHTLYVQCRELAERQRADRLVEQKHWRRHVRRGEAGCVRVAVGLALLTAKAARLHARGGSRHSTSQGQGGNGGWPSRSVTTAAQSVSTGARLIWIAMAEAKPVTRPSARPRAKVGHR